MIPKIRISLGVGIIAVVWLGLGGGAHDKVLANENSQDGGLGDQACPGAAALAEKTPLEQELPSICLAPW